MDVATSSHIVLGISIGLLASFIQSLGLTIQRKSHVLNESLPEHQQRVEHRRPLWLLGFAIFISSNIIGSLVQIASLPVVILAPLGAVSLLWNAFFARLLLGDVFSPWMILGTLLIAGGAILIAVFGIVPEPTRSLEDLLALFRRPAFIVYFSLLGATVLVSLIITHAAEFSFNRRLARNNLRDISPPRTNSAPLLNVPENPSVLTTGVTDTITDAITTERTPLLDRKSNPSSASVTSSRSPSRSPRHNDTPEGRSINRTRLALAISYSSFSGIISGMCLLFAKSGVELLLLTLRGQNQFWRWQAWVLVLGLVAFALLQLWYLHKALILADPTLVCPSAFCFYNLSSIVNGLVYFDQFSLIPPLHLGLVVLGIFVLLGGVWIVSIHTGGHRCRLVVAEPENNSRVEPTRPPPLFSRSRSELNIYTVSPDEALLSPVSTMSTPLPTSPPPVRGSGTGLYGAAARRPRSSHIRAQTTASTYSELPSPSAPVPNPVAALGAGLQIGLSPVSPGFGIGPGRERGRITSGLHQSYAFGDVVEQAHAATARRARERRRRTVSEGDARRTRALAVERAALLEGTGLPRHSDVDVVDTETRVRSPTRAKERWRWLASLFSR
ncbi:hypothetical protein MSAN_02161900 [Mycena sanguinolenta]|uniref:Uncharacterized protein n=1 Tax=Mycena sanguinolenta TaxID=230812 RepID=A0A8H7CKG7_9AGAR|nr:hypothetical protein MSAN_02161900 [Mycena sanguinolenta]